MVEVDGLKTKREIDILYETQTGPYRVKIAVEVKDEKRKMDLEEFDGYVGLYCGPNPVKVDKFAMVSRYTDTYVKRDGKWQVVASHLSNAPPAKKDPPANEPTRPVEGNAVVSPASAAARIEVDKELPHVGSLTFVLKDVADVERAVFARSGDGGRVKGMFIAQFESVRPGVKGGYSFAVTNPTRLGKHDYQTSVGFFNFAEAAAASPGAEADHTRAFLAKHGLAVDKDDFLVARYARVTDDAKRHELILFYYENLAGLGVTRVELGPGGRREDEREKLFREFADRAVRRFKVVDRTP